MRAPHAVVHEVLRVRTGDGLFGAEQRARLDLDEHDRIARMHVMCVGYRPLAD